MTEPPGPRRARTFEPDDPTLVFDDVADAAAATDAAAAGLPDGAAPAIARPTFGDLERGWRWGAILFGALATAASIAAGLWFARFVSVALARDDWVGWLVVVLIGVAAFAAFVLLGRELVGMFRLRRLASLKRDFSDLLATPDAGRERAAVRRLLAAYAGRPELAGNVARLKTHIKDVHDAGNLIALADSTVMGPLDGEARARITGAAKRVATVTAMSPIATLTVGYVLVENLRLMRVLATLYGGRPGFIGSLRLARMVVANIIATGGLALTDDLLGQFLGQDVLRRLSRRLGEGAFNGAMTARFGVAAIAVIRPLPHLATPPVRLRAILAEVLRRKAPAEPASAG